MDRLTVCLCLVSSIQRERSAVGSTQFATLKSCTSVVWLGFAGLETVLAFLSRSLVYRTVLSLSAFDLCSVSGLLTLAKSCPCGGIAVLCLGFVRITPCDAIAGTKDRSLSESPDLYSSVHRSLVGFQRNLPRTRCNKCKSHRK